MSNKNTSRNSAPRLFVAARLRPENHAWLASQLDDYRAAAGNRAVRWLAPASWHMTLRFIGASRAKDPIVQALTSVLGGPVVSARADTLGPFPSDRPVVLALQLEAGPELHGLVISIEEALRNCGLEPEPRPYRAHISVARLKPVATPQSWPQREFNCRFGFDQVVLFDSQHSPQGRRHIALHRWSLPDPEGMPRDPA